MNNKFKSYWDYGSTFCGVEISTVQGANSFFITKAKKKENEFKDFEFTTVGSLKEVSNVINKNQHCFLTINTDQVLIKGIDSEKDIQKAVSIAFPSLSQNDFYYEVLQAENKSFVAICRKEYIDNLLTEIKQQNIDVIGFHLGFSCISKIASLIDEVEIETSKHSLTKVGLEIENFSPLEYVSPKKYRIDDEQISSEYLLSLSSLFSYVSLEENNNFKNILDLLKENQKQKNFFRKGLVVGVGILLFSLLLNFFCFNSYYKKLKSKQEEVQLVKSKKETISLKKLEIESKEKIVENIFNSTQSKSSYYMNRIVSDLPSSLLFQKIEYQPLEKTIRPDKEIENNKNSILVHGESGDELFFTNWIESLEELEWTKNVTITNYGQNSSQNSEFSLNIQF